MNKNMPKPPRMQKMDEPVKKPSSAKKKGSKKKGGY
jgi:hypothetical protein